MNGTDSASWRTDPALFAAIPGGQAVIDWFGFAPSFHDATLERLDVSGDAVSLVLKAFRMSDDVAPEGHFVLDRHALVAFRMTGVSALRLVGNATAIVSNLRIRRLAADLPDWDTCAGPRAGDYELAFEASYGLEGSIWSRNLRLELAPP